MRRTSIAEVQEPLLLDGMAEGILGGIEVEYRRITRGVRMLRRCCRGMLPAFVSTLSALQQRAYSRLTHPAARKQLRRSDSVVVKE